MGSETDLVTADNDPQKMQAEAIMRDKCGLPSSGDPCMAQNDRAA